MLSEHQSISIEDKKSFNLTAGQGSRCKGNVMMTEDFQCALKLY